MSPDKKTLFWLAGENSGDLHAAGVIAKLPEYNHFGIGGPRMQKCGLKPMFEFSRFSVMGFLEVLEHLKFFLGVERSIKRLFREHPPDLVILVDYPGLNMRIAKMAKKFSIPVLYYICPQFWAWKQRRIHDLKKYTDHVAFILPFEQSFLNEHEIQSTYVGHPIAEEINKIISREDFAKNYDLDPAKTWLGFLPGSRNHEIKRILPEYLKIISLFDNNKFEFLISKAPTVDKRTFYRVIQKAGKLQFRIVKDNYGIMKYSKTLIVTSGTATLETAFIGTPFIIVYKANALSYAIGKQLVKLDRIGLPNIILNQKIIPEFIQKEANAKKLYQALQSLLVSKEKYEEIKSNLEQLHNLLGEKSASQEVAQIIKGMLHE